MDLSPFKNKSSKCTALTESVVIVIIISRRRSCRLVSRRHNSFGCLQTKGTQTILLLVIVIIKVRSNNNIKA